MCDIGQLTLLNLLQVANSALWDFYLLWLNSLVFLGFHIFFKVQVLERIWRDLLGNVRVSITVTGQTCKVKMRSYTQNFSRTGLEQATCSAGRTWYSLALKWLQLQARSLFSLGLPLFQLQFLQTLSLQGFGFSHPEPSPWHPQWAVPRDRRTLSRDRNVGLSDCGYKETNNQPLRGWCSLISTLRRNTHFNYSVHWRNLETLIFKISNSNLAVIGQKAQKLSMWMVQEETIQQQPKCPSQVKTQPWILQKFILGFLLVTKLLPHHLLTGILPGARLGAWGCSVGRWPSLLGAEIIGFFKAKREHRDKSINMKKTHTV